MKKPWPLVGKASARVAPEFLPQKYGQHRRAKAYALDWCEKKHQVGLPLGKLMVRYGMMLDIYLLYDTKRGCTKITNNATIEVVCRDMYGIVKAFRKVKTAADLKVDPKTGRSKVNWAARDEYDVAAIHGADISCAHADQELGRMLKAEQAAEKVFAGAKDE